MTLKKMLVQ